MVDSFFALDEEVLEVMKEKGMDVEGLDKPKNIPDKKPLEPFVEDDIDLSSSLVFDYEWFLEDDIIIDSLGEFVDAIISAKDVSYMDVLSKYLLIRGKKERGKTIWFSEYMSFVMDDSYGYSAMKNIINRNDSINSLYYDVLNELSGEILEHNKKYIASLFAIKKGLPSVYSRVFYKLSFDDSVKASYINKMITDLFYDIDSMFDNLALYDYELAKRKEIVNSRDKWVVGNSYEILEDNYANTNGKEWHLYKNSFIPMLISFETRECIIISGSKKLDVMKKIIEDEEN